MVYYIDYAAFFLLEEERLRNFGVLFEFGWRKVLFCISYAFLRSLPTFKGDLFGVKFLLLRH